MNLVMAVLLILAIVMCVVMAIAIIVAYFTHPLWLPALWYKLATRNLFVTMVEEGTGKWIMKSGKAWRFITTSVATDPASSALNPKNGWNVAIAVGMRKRKDTKWKGLWNANGRESLWVEWIDGTLPGGIRWVGILPFIYKIYWYNFRWSVLRESKPLETEDGMVGEPRDLKNGKWVASFAKRIDYIFLRDAVYYLELDEAQTRGSSDPKSKDKSVGITVKIYMVATIRVVNPYDTLFKVHDWLSSIFDLLRPSIRSQVSQLPFQDVVGKFEATKREYDLFLQTAVALPESAAAKIKGGLKPQPTIAEYLEYAYGVRIKRIAFDDVIPPGDYTKSVNLRAEAEQNKIRIHTEATAEADRLETTAKGEAARVEILTKAITAGGDDARLVRTLEAYETMGANGNTIVLGGKKPVQMLLETSKTTKGGAK
jgi:regulator of protease activity HflC (stomatin/prohibitin superfamily)